MTTDEPVEGKCKECLHTIAFHHGGGCTVTSWGHRCTCKVETFASPSVPVESREQPSQKGSNMIDVQPDNNRMIYHVKIGSLNVDLATNYPERKWDRCDTIFVRQLDNGLLQIGVCQGISATCPVEPALPKGAHRVAGFQVRASSDCTATAIRLAA